MGRALHAQIYPNPQVYPGDIQRRVPVNRRPVPAVPGAVPRGLASAESCKALVAWMSILEREYPQVDFRLTAIDRLYPKAINLFRDDYFASFFGKPLSQTTFLDLRNYDQTVFRACGPNQLTPQEQATLQKLRTILERPFILNAGSFSYQQVVIGVAERQKLVQWKDGALRQLQALPVSPEGFESLEGFSQKGKTDLENLFPGELQAFLQAVESRRRSMQPLLADKLVQSAEVIPLGPDGAKDIRYLRSRYDRYLQGLDPTVLAKMNARLDELTTVALGEVLKKYKARLTAIPQALEGALSLAAWQRDFDIEVAGVNPTPGMQALRTEAATKRRDCLTKGLVEFKALVAQYPKPGRTGGNAEDLLAQLFPAETQQSPEYSQYRNLLTARTDQLKAEEARVQKAKTPPATTAAKQPAPAPPVSGGQAKTCDSLAGHPGDPGLKEQPGVTEAELVPTEAIKQCTLAVQKEPKNARYQFELGRAYWVGKQYDRAVASLLAAEELQYAPAYHYLGLAYEQGRIKGEPPDKVLAADLRKMAIAGGFDADAVKVDPVVAIAEDAPLPTSVEKADDLDASVFKEPTWVKALFSGELELLNRSRFNALTYAGGMLDFLSVDPNEYDATCLKLVDPSLSEKISFELAGFKDGKVDMGAVLGVLRQAMTNPGALAANAARNEKTSQNGVDDMSVLSEDYGKCSGPVVRRVYSNLVRLVKEKPQASQQAGRVQAPQQTAQDLAPQKAALTNSLDRAPQAEDVQGVSDPALLGRLQQELQDAAARGFVITECTYGAGDKKLVAAHWKNAMPTLSDSLRAAMPGVIPVALAHCGKQEGYPGAFRSVFNTPPPMARLTETSPRISELPRPPLTRAMPPNQQMYMQEAFGYSSPLVACKSQSEPYPSYFWRNALPQIRGAVNWDYLQFVYRYWHVLPAAVTACPPSATAVNASLAFKDY